MNAWRRLPIPLAPAQQETIASWLHRLATVHGLNSTDLRQQLGISHSVQPADQTAVAAQQLSAVTGYPATRLAWALPELRLPAPDWRALRHLAQRACPRCTTRHQGGPVRRLFAHHEYLCTRHGYWIGPPDPTRDDPPPQLAGQLPELVAAQRRLGCTAARYGWVATFDATAAATSICVNLRFSAEHHPLWTRWQQRLDLLMRAGYRRSLFMAAIYPEVAALAPVLLASGWQVPATADKLGLDHVIDAALRALGVDAMPRQQIGSAVMAWLMTRGSGPLLEPVSTHPRTSHHDDGIPRITEAQRQAEHRTAHRFAQDRRAPRTHSRAAPLPYAHRPTATSVPGGRSS